MEHRMPRGGVRLTTGKASSDRLVVTDNLQNGRTDKRRVPRLHQELHDSRRCDIRRWTCKVVVHVEYFLLMDCNHDYRCVISLSVALFWQIVWPYFKISSSGNEATVIKRLGSGSVINWSDNNKGFPASSSPPFLLFPLIPLWNPINLCLRLDGSHTLSSAMSRGNTFDGALMLSDAIMEGGRKWAEKGEETHWHLTIWPERNDETIRRMGCTWSTIDLLLHGHLDLKVELGREDEKNRKGEREFDTFDRKT